MLFQTAFFCAFSWDFWHKGVDQISGQRYNTSIQKHQAPKGGNQSGQVKSEWKGAANEAAYFSYRYLGFENSWLDLKTK